MFQLNYRNAAPIYQQICDNLRGMILTGTLAEGERVPSVRELAVQLAINPNTIQRAYRTLEAEGYRCTLPGKGSFAARPAEPRVRLESQWRALDAAARELMLLGVPAREIAAHIGEGTHHD